MTVFTGDQRYDVSAVYVLGQIRGDVKNITSIPLERTIQFGIET